ncbi:MAG: hypothetical protein IJP90_12475 [Treponema sp.]|nr:hypothetical protein [Treponema sp.]
MKKLKTICSAIAALTMLALAGCDLEVPDSEKVEFYASDFSTDEKLPQTIAKAGIDMKLDPMTSFKKSDDSAWTKEDGVSFSFYLTGYTKDWSMIFQVPSGNWGTTTAHYCENSVWKANAWGCQNGNGTFDQFNNVDCFVTISMDYSTGTMTYYKDGQKVTVYGTGTNGGFNGGDAAFPLSDVSEWIKSLIDDIAESGIYCIHPSDSWANAGAGSYSMKSFTLDVAVDADGAKAKYDAYTASVSE